MNERVQTSAPTNDEVISALSRTGFILEYRVAQILRTAGYTADINYAYLDATSGKSREIDVYAYIERDVKRTPVSVGVSADIVVECKNTTNPFVLVGERDNSAYKPGSRYLSFEPLRLEFPGKERWTTQEELGLLDLDGFRKRGEFLGRQLVRMDRQGGTWRADNNSIYDSILYPLAKAWAYEMEAAQGTEEDRQEGWKVPYITYVFPIIVTAGPIFTVDVTAEDPLVSQVGWATLRRTFKSDEISGDVYVDVVSFANLADYLDSRISKAINNTISAVAANIHIYDPEWLLANLGEPKDREVFDAWRSDLQQQRRRSF